MTTKTFIKNFVTSHLKIQGRLQNTVSNYILSLMVDVSSHTQRSSAEISGLNQSQFSKLLSGNRELAIDSLRDLGKKNATSLSKQKRTLLASGTTWTVAVIIDATLHKRSSLHLQNSQRFNHGKGFVVGHQWTNIVIHFNEKIIPLPPIPFFSINECKRRKILYKTEHERLIEYFENFDLTSIIGPHEENEIVVLTDSGYDNKKLQNMVLDKGWDFISSLKCSRGARTTKNSTLKKTSCRIDELFWATRKQAPWKTVCVKTHGEKKRRKFRTRQLKGFINGVGHEVALVCSEKSGRTGRRYFACSKQEINAGVVMRVYAKRWKIEMFHRAVKQQFGLLDAGVKNFDSLISHVHWVYCAYLLLQEADMQDAKTLCDKQKKLTKLVRNEPWQLSLKKILAAKTQAGGRKRQETLIGMALDQSIAA